MPITRKNVTFYASSEALDVLAKNELRKGDKSQFINEAIERYSRLADFEKDLELALNAAVNAYINTSGLTLHELMGELAKQKRLARSPEELYG